MTDFIPEKYNWLRMSFFKHTKWQRMAGRDTRIVHWTGEIGKKILTRAIREKKNTIDIVKEMV
jgi:methionyl-tRNA synthetase